ncbi:hypothetical protein AB0I94_32665 [Streptomyces sp. NPDC050147]|uniref:hypothetical protein n=1 Tax=Streptomyces sp. NPDC050147 TaxID=3155513 RepID=UPI0034268385
MSQVIRTKPFSLLKVAQLAGVSAKTAYAARDRGVLDPCVLGASDALPLRTFDALRRFSWPGTSCARNVPRRLRRWESGAIEQSRLDIEAVDRRAGLYVHRAGAVLVVKPSGHASVVQGLLAGEEPFLLLPLGAWAHETRRGLQRTGRG